MNQQSSQRALQEVKRYAKVELDSDIPHLYRISQKSEEFDTVLRREDVRMHFIGQDKASCVPVHCLVEGEGNLKQALAIDCTAAPGNKTLQLAQHFSHVLAFERNKKRFALLKNRIKKYKGEREITCIQGRFEEKIKDYLPMLQQAKEGVYVIVDPSCSGTGARNFMEDASVCAKDINTIKQKESQFIKPEELEKYTDLQFSLLLTALRLPNLKKLIYSTCSITTSQNERIIKRIKKLKIQGLKRIRIKFKIQSPHKICEYTKKGKGIFEESKDEISKSLINDNEKPGGRKYGLRLCGGCDEVESGFFVSGFFFKD